MDQWVRGFVCKQEAKQQNPKINLSKQEKRNSVVGMTYKLKSASMQWGQGQSSLGTSITRTNMYSLESAITGMGQLSVSVSIPESNSQKTVSNDLIWVTVLSLD